MLPAALKKYMVILLIGSRCVSGAVIKEGESKKKKKNAKEIRKGYGKENLGGTSDGKW